MRKKVPVVLYAPSNKLLQLSLMDSAEISLSRNPAAVNGAAEPGR